MYGWSTRFSVPSMASVAVAAAILVVTLSGTCTEAYVSSASLRQSSAGKIRYSPMVKEAGRGVHKRREDGSAVTLYLYPTPLMAADHRRQQRSRRRTDSTSSSAARPGTSRSGGSKTSLPAMSMSDSVLATCNTLPSFHTAHGLLSPEVVMRIADTNDLVRGEPLHTFLKMYKSRGPMACLPMLSDPCVLPELTRAMREIA